VPGLRRRSAVLSALAPFVSFPVEQQSPSPPPKKTGSSMRPKKREVPVCGSVRGLLRRVKSLKAEETEAIKRTKEAEKEKM
jgi:hypothetical protein